MMGHRRAGTIVNHRLGVGCQILLWLIYFFSNAKHDHVNAECIVRSNDCSYALLVPTASVRARRANTTAPLTILEGSPVKLLDRGVWMDLPCQAVTQIDNSTWVMDYDALTLRVQNHVPQNGDEVVCSMTFTTTRDVVVGGGKNIDDVLTTFPSFWMRNELESSQLPLSSQLDGRLSWRGAFMRPQINAGCSTGVRGGPCVLFQRDDPAHGTAIVLSALDHFLVTTQVTELPKDSYSPDQKLIWGASTVASIDILPQGYSHSFIVVVGQDGVTDTIGKWGRFLRKHYKLPPRMNDITIQTLGYQTDAGAQYCHCEEHCDTALLQVMDDLRRNLRVPVQYLSYQNAWWQSSWSAYWCVSDWRSWNSTKVPMGVPEFARLLDLPLQLYAPYFCNDTTYYDTNFTLLASNTSLPLCQEFDFRQIVPQQSFEFYEWFFSQGISYGMVSYELDFVMENLICIDDLRSNVSTADMLFQGMAEAAQLLNIPMQWCIATPAFALQSLMYPSVTNMRASVDYPGGVAWDIGIPSLLLWALNIAPSKDTFWTTDNGDTATTMGGCDPPSCPKDHSNTGCELHAIIAIMSMGPVAFSDAINHTDAELILRTCRSDGVLLQPSKPLTTMDSHLEQRWRILHSYSGQSVSHVWAYYIVAHRLSDLPGGKISVDMNELWPRPRPDSNWFLVWNGGNHGSTCTADGAPASSCGQFVAANSTITISTLSDDFQAIRINVFPVCPPQQGASDSWVLLGELSKFVSLSPSRFGDIECLGSSGLVFKVYGAKDENVTISAIRSGVVHVQTLTLDHNGGHMLSFGGLERAEIQK